MVQELGLHPRHVDAGRTLAPAALALDAQVHRVADQIEAGMVYVNGVGLDSPELPFGGIKRSGFGRELAAFGLREFVNAKTVWIG